MICLLTEKKNVGISGFDDRLKASLNHLDLSLLSFQLCFWFCSQRLSSSKNPTKLTVPTYYFFVLGGLRESGHMVPPTYISLNSSFMINIVGSADLLLRRKVDFQEPELPKGCHQSLRICNFGSVLRTR